MTVVTAHTLGSLAKRVDGAVQKPPQLPALVDLYWLDNTHRPQGGASATLWPQKSAPSDDLTLMLPPSPR